MNEIISAWNKGSNVDFIMPSSEDSIKNADRLENIGMREKDKKKREQYFDRANYYRSLAALYNVLSARQRKK